jgi:hypothetical protein
MALALATVSVVMYVARQRQVAALKQLIAETGLEDRQPDTVARILWDPDVELARLQVARALVYEALDPSVFSKLPTREAMDAMSRVSDRLELARTIAAETLRRRPAAWQAAMILGAVPYVEWSLRGDPRLVTDRAAWEKPLRLAMEIAPGEEEPRQFLALAYLEIWPALSDQDQTDARPLLAQAFEDRATFSRAAAYWLAAAGNRGSAFALVPDATWAWQTLQTVYARSRDWDGFVAAWQRREAALGHELEVDLQDVEERLRGGDVRGARTAALGILGDAPPDGRWAPVIQRVLEIMPPGPADGSAKRVFRGWLQWALGAYLWDYPGLSPAAVRRLAGALDDLPAPDTALAALAAGDLPGAEVLERRSEALNTEPWGPYCIAKARLLAKRGEVKGARAILGLTQRDWEATVPALQARREVAAAASDSTALAAADRALAAAAASAWPNTAWRWSGRTAWTGVLPATHADALVLNFDVLPSSGAVVSVDVDGRTIITAAVARDEPLLRVPADLTLRAHYLEVSAVAGGRVVPGAFHLDLPAPSGEATGAKAQGSTNSPP